MRFDKAAVESLDEGLLKIRDELQVPSEFPSGVLAAADEAAARDPRGGRADRTQVEFATIDPASSTDLDQAFAIERAGDDLVLHYAIADVAFFARPGDVLDNEAWKRGVTVYLPVIGRLSTHRRSPRAQPACSPTGHARQWCSRCVSTPRVP